MTSGRSFGLNKPAIYIQPKNFADYLPHQQDYYLFLDIDGTLADFTLNPKDSFIPDITLAILQKIQRYGVKIAIVTGRSLAEARELVFPLQLPIAASHGLEIALVGDGDEANIVSVDTIELTVIRQAIIELSNPFEGLTVENKPYSVALHFRQNPALVDVAYTIMQRMLKKYPSWTLKPGKCVWEMAPKEANKGTAILTLLQKMQSSDNVYPIFIGDDITDEAGFMAIQGENITMRDYLHPIEGLGIKVGSEPTCARYYIHNIHEVTILLNSFLRFCQENSRLSKGS